MADDVFILQTSGIPLYGKCFGGDFCKSHPDHALQTGFLAAMYSFSQESFGQKDLKSVIFRDIRLDFKIDKEKEIIMVFVNPLGTKDVESQLDLAMKIFLDKFGSKIGPIVNEEFFNDFEQDLLDLNIVRNQSMDDISKKLRGSKSLINRILRFFRIR
ncbi:MAG: hypothetical protein ACFFAU_15860 [Candidatus Hodarchaeota archaeon]